MGVPSTAWHAAAQPRRAEGLGASLGAGGIHRERDHRVAVGAFGVMSSGRWENASAGTGPRSIPGPCHSRADLLAAGGLEHLHEDRVEPLLEVHFRAAGPRGVHAAVVDDDLAVEMEARAVVGARWKV